jgi:hydrogenase maturation protease
MSNPTLVIGIGSPHGEDQIGWKVIQSLQDRVPLPCPVDVGTVSQPWNLLDYFQSQQLAVLVDACVTGSTPGTVTVLETQDLTTNRFQRSSSHGSTVVEALELATILGIRPKHIKILAIEISAWSPDALVSAPVQQAIPLAVDRIIEIVSLHTTSNPT